MIWGAANAQRYKVVELSIAEGARSAGERLLLHGLNARHVSKLLSQQAQLVIVFCWVTGLFRISLWVVRRGDQTGTDAWDCAVIRYAKPLWSDLVDLRCGKTDWHLIPGRKCLLSKFTILVIQITRHVARSQNLWKIGHGRSLATSLMFLYILDPLQPDLIHQASSRHLLVTYQAPIFRMIDCDKGWAAFDVLLGLLAAICVGSGVCGSVWAPPPRLLRLLLGVGID